MMRVVFVVLFGFACWGCSEFAEEVDPGRFTELAYPLTEMDTALPIVNIVVDQDAFDDLYTNFEDDIEIDGTFELYRNQELVVEEEISLELRGSYSLRFPLKSLGVQFEDKYDNRDRSLINPPQLLPFHAIDEIKSIRLRNSGNDFYNTMLKDLSYTRLAIEAGLDVELAYGEPSLVFVNDVFYGLLNIRTEVNARGVAGLYNGKRSDVTMAKMEGGVVVLKDGEPDWVDALVEAIRERDIEYLYSKIDIDNYIDYMIFESYVVNEDWPANNARFYAIEDSKFRFVLFDLDVANLSLIGKAPMAFLDQAGGGFVSDLFFVLYEEERFREQFWARYAALLERGALSVERFESIMLANFDHIKQAMPLQIERYQAPESLVEWYVEVDRLSFLFAEREEVIRSEVE